MDFKTKFFSGLIGLLCIIIVLQRCTPNINTKINYKDSTHITYDTVPIFVKGKGTDKPKEIDSIPYTIYQTQYIPDTSSTKKLFVEYQILYGNYSEKRIYNDKISLDTLGFVNITDTVQFNTLQNRHFEYSLKFKEVNKTITVDHYIPPTRQFYVGGGIFGNKSNPIYGGEIGVIYKDRKDRIFQLTGKVDANAQFTIGVGTYWKIKL